MTLLELATCIMPGTLIRHKSWRPGKTVTVSVELLRQLGGNSYCSRHMPSSVRLTKVSEHGWSVADNTIPRRWSPTQVTATKLFRFVSPSRKDMITLDVESVNKTEYPFIGVKSLPGHLPQDGNTPGDTYAVGINRTVYMWKISKTKGYWDPIGALSHRAVNQLMQ